MLGIIFYPGTRGRKKSGLHSFSLKLVGLPFAYIYVFVFLLLLTWRVGTRLTAHY